LFGGGLYDLAMKPYTAYYSNTTGFLFLYPQISEQFISDSIVATILYSLGVVGLIAIYQSTKYVYKPRQAYMMFIVGTVLLLLAYIFLEAAIQQKIG
jgi:membrane-bound ClpP family serine protease